MKFISKIIVFSTLSLSMWFISGCRQPNFINLTSKNVSQNPSGIYTLQTELEIQDRGIKVDTVSVFAVVGGEKLVMVQDELNPELWSCDYKLPTGFDEATYYFEANYASVLDNGNVADRRVTSDLQVFRLENRYVGNLASYRGPVGAEIAVQGRGLTKYDVIKVGEQDATTRFLSENELRFVLPALPSGLDYPVKLSRGAYGALDVGNFRVHESRLGVTFPSLELQPGDTATLLFKIDFQAPAGGLAIDVKTNIPNSVIMPEAIIAEGDMTVNIPVKGGEAGEGKLVISAPGYEGAEVSVKVY